MATKKRKRTRHKKAAKRKPVKRRTIKRRVKRRKVGAVRRKAAPKKRKKRKGAKRVVKQVERRSVERVMAGRKKRRRSRKKRAVSGTRRRRSVGKNDGSGKMLVGLAIGAAAIYLLTKGSSQSPTYPSNYQLPPVMQTGNLTRNTQSQDIVNYAIAGGLAIDAIVKLIEKLNSSSDQQVQNTYDVMRTTGEVYV